MTLCAAVHCGRTVAPGEHGSPRKYCSDYCRNRTHEARRKPRPARSTSSRSISVKPDTYDAIERIAAARNIALTAVIDEMVDAVMPRIDVSPTAADYIARRWASADDFINAALDGMESR